MASLRTFLTSIVFGIPSKVAAAPKPFQASGALIVFVAVWAAYRKWKWQRSPLSRYPGPADGNILAGHFFQLIGSKYGELFSKWAHQFGDMVAFDMFIAGTRLMICNAGVIKHILVSNASKYCRPRFIHLLLEPLLGMGLMFSQGEQHNRQRKIISDAFRFENLSKLTHHFYNCAEKMVNDWLIEIDGFSAFGASTLEIDLMQAMHNLTLDIIGLAGFGYDFKACSNQHTELGDAYKAFASCVTVSLGNIIRHMWPFNLLPLPLILKERRACDQIRAAVDAIIRKRHEELRAAAGDAAATARLEGDLLGLMLRAATQSADTVGLSDEEVRDNIITFLTLGQMPMAHHLVWTLYLLAKNPESADRVRAEVRRATAGARGRALTARELEEMPYLNAVIKESLRLYPPLPTCIRVPVATEVVCGHELPAGEVMLIPINVLQRHQSLWNRPDEFLPRRFLPGSTIDKDRERHQYKWCPFLAGPRNCIGSRFAQLQAGMVVAAIVSRLRLEVPPGHPEPYGRQGDLLLRPHPFVRLWVTPLPLDDSDDSEAQIEPEGRQ